ncbi:hypothetical protein JB92DRAFT_2872146 [Gautieria morchelliformis]|nr:hypothetical protein JB92DRAFT_2872146 [Gautieria morchelliformis]
MSNTMAALREALEISHRIREAVSKGVPESTDNGPITSSVLIQVPTFFLPTPLTPTLVALGLPHDVADAMSNAYMRQAEELKRSLEEKLHNTWAQLSSVRLVAAVDHQKKFQTQLCNVYHHMYQSSLLEWANQAIDLVKSRLSFSPELSPPVAPVNMPISPDRKSKRRFKSEYLPLFEFAFEKDRFPSREDKKHLARISGMSLRQVTTWFQNRRCRPPARAQSSRATTAPRTFEEMRERLGDSAREALSKSHPLTKKLNPDPTEHYGTYELPILMQGPPRRSAVPEIIVLDDDTPPEPSTLAVSPGVTEDAPSPWSCSDERVGLTDYGLLGTAVYQLPTSIEEHTPMPPSDNPLNPPKTSVHAYPAVYEPSQLTSDPFVVAPHAWLRDRRANTRESIDTTAEAVADILSGFDTMDVDEPSEKMKGGRLPRNVSSESELYGIWYSSESTIASPCSSSAGSSPLSSEAELPTSSENALEAHLDSQSACTVEIPEYAVSPASGASLDPEAKTRPRPRAIRLGTIARRPVRLVRLKNQARVAESTK